MRACGAAIATPVPRKDGNVPTRDKWRSERRAPQWRADVRLVRPMPGQLAVKPSISAYILTRFVLSFPGAYFPSHAAGVSFRKSSLSSW